MARHSSIILPRGFPHGLRARTADIRVSEALRSAALADVPSVLSRLGTTPAGLSTSDAEERLEQHGRNAIAEDRRQSWPALLGLALVNPLVILLAVLAAISFATGDPRAGTVMLVMVAIGVGLRFVQEYRAGSAAAKLKAMIHVTATVLRDGAAQERPVDELVPGDIVQLAAGDMVPADVRLLAAKDLFVVQASLTGESLPVEKSDAAGNGLMTNGPATGNGLAGEQQADRGPASTAAPAPSIAVPAASILDLHNVCFLGTSISSGSGTAVVVCTGLETYLGTMSTAIVSQPEPTSFDRGISRFTWLMIGLIAVMVPLVFLINGLTKGDWREAFFFALAVAVGLTPEMLPMIVTVCLSRGAIEMSRNKVIVKRLNSMQNLGAMDVLCTDKTGTLTLDQVVLFRHCDVVRRDDRSVLEMAFMNSQFQTGLRNLLDRAVLSHEGIDSRALLAGYHKLDEIPFDFSRRIMSVVVETPEHVCRLIAKGAPEALFPRCNRFELDGRIHELDPLLIEDLRQEHDSLSADGFRVLALAYRDLDRRPAYSKNDESELVLKGYLAFLDPPKQTAGPAVRALKAHGVAVKVLTGDNPLVTSKVCREVGLEVGQLLLGEQIAAMSEEQLAAAAKAASVFARLSPADKQRIIRALRAAGHVVGFLGDGINDAPALRAADVGISVDTAVDIAKESADVILLEKNLLVLEQGVLGGRKVFANILKYIRMGASSNFGNVFSVLGASAFLPFLPMAPIQILTNNLLYDFSQLPIPGDNVDPEQIAQPRPWSIRDISRFILCIGPISSLFDYVTFGLLLYGFGCWDPARAAFFQSGWFVESLVTQTLIIHVIRTNRIAFVQSRASRVLTLTTASVMAIGVWLPYSPLAPPLGLVPLPGRYLLFVAGVAVGYMAVTQVAKTWLQRRGWI